jgi:hypothetical protein
MMETSVQFASGPAHHSAVGAAVRRSCLATNSGLNLRDCRIGRLLDSSLRSPSRDLDLLARLVPDRPDGDLGLLAQLLDCLAISPRCSMLIGETLTLKVVGFSA